MFTGCPSHQRTFAELGKHNKVAYIKKKSDIARSNGGYEENSYVK